MSRTGRVIGSIFLAAALLLGTAPSAVAAQNVPPGDTPLGDYSAAPYRDVVRFVERFNGARFVEIPEEYIFDPKLLDRKVVVGGREWQDLVFVMLMDDVTGETLDTKFYVYDLMEDTKWGARVFLEEVYNPSEMTKQLPLEERLRRQDEAYQFVVQQALAERVGSSQVYPYVERFVSINGRPWQETEWRDTILELVRELPKNTTPLLNDPELWQIFMNPAYNGRGADVYFGLGEWAQKTSPVTENTAVLETSAVPEASSDSESGDPAAAASGPETATPQATGTEPVTEPSAGQLERSAAATDVPAPPVEKKVEIGTSEAVNQVVLALGSDKVVQYRAGKTEAVSLSAPVTAVDGTTMIPLVGVLDGLGVQVTQWNNLVVASNGDNVLVMQVGSAEALLNGATVTLGKPVTQVDGRTLIPLRSVAEALGYTVLWDAQTRQIIVSK